MKGSPPTRQRALLTRKVARWPTLIGRAMLCPPTDRYDRCTIMNVCYHTPLPLLGHPHSGPTLPPGPLLLGHNSKPPHATP